jgi:serine/threonine protein kinase, bacterial
MQVRQLTWGAALAAAVVAGGPAAAPSAYAADPVLDGTYRFDFDGAHQTYNGGSVPAANTSTTYSFSSSCAGESCIARGVLLNTTDKEAVSAHNPDVTLQFVDGVWQLSLPYDSPCPEGDERNQLLTWSLTPQAGNDVLSGSRTVATIGHSCAGDATGSMSQPMTATRIGSTAPGVLPMP